MTVSGNASTATADQQVELLHRVAAADTPRKAAAEIVRLAQEQPACRSAIVWWGLGARQEPASEPLSAAEDEDLALGRTAAASAAPVASADGRRLAIGLSEAQGVVLLLTLDGQADHLRFAEATRHWLKPAALHLGRLLELADLRASLTRLERSERLQHALFAISDLAGSDREMSDVLRSIHEIVGTLMYAENLYIVRHDDELDTLRILYFVDTQDPAPRGDNRDIPMSAFERSPTWYLLRDGKPLMGGVEQLRTQISGPLAIVGPASHDWLGVPMMREGRACGAIVVQSYRDDIGYSNDDRALLEFVANHILTALERKQGKQDLEQRVRLRTAELQQEIVERQRTERLQKALFQIAQLATDDISQKEFCQRVHAVVGALLDAENFFIALLSEDGRSLEFPYYIDSTGRIQTSRPLGLGLSEYVIRQRRLVWGMTQDIVALADRGEIALQTSGPPAVCWLGVPLFDRSEAIGLIAVQSYDAAVVYGPADQELLSFVASQVANSLLRRRSSEVLRAAYAQLEQRVLERTIDLTYTLRLQRSLFAISDLAGSDRDMSHVLRGIHEIVGTLMYAENFYIVLHDTESDTLRFMYFADVKDPSPSGINNDVPLSELERSLTWYLLRDARPLMGTTAQLIRQTSGPLKIVGTEAHDWLGVPMLRDGRARGAIVVQSYKEDVGYLADDKTLLEFVADHILTALERKQGKQDLEQRVRLRTAELQQEIVERQRAERLQKALFQVAELATADINQNEFCQRVHAVVGGLLDAENFFIALLSGNGASLEFPYYIDSTGRHQTSRPLGRGLSEYVIRRGKPLRGMTQDIVDLAACGEIDAQKYGPSAVCWLGVPLFVGNRVIGLIVVQSYDVAVVYSPADQELLSFVASQVANSQERRRSAEALRVAYAQLERRVQDRTRDLTHTLAELRNTQDELIRQEKLASLGGLVSGMAHEINTPLGICVTATTHLQDELRYWRSISKNESLDPRRFDAMLDDLGVSLDVLHNNIYRGVELVRSFKQIAVDQSLDERRQFDLAEYLREIVMSLETRMKRGPYAIRVDCSDGIGMDTFPGALSKVVSNLIMNALLHAFEGRSAGTVTVQGETEGEDILLTVGDDGNGMCEADLKRYWDPFFTTRRGSGSIGLGAHIVFNQVTNGLGGTIQVTSTPGSGTRVQMRMPRTLGEADMSA